MMKSTNDKNSDKNEDMIDENKRRYEKPLLRVIDLEAEQVLGAGCKLDSSGLAPGSTPCVANYCAQAGS